MEIEVKPVGIKPGDVITSRESYKRIKGFNHKDLDEWLVGFYKQAFLDGANAVEKALTEEHEKEQELMPFEPEMAWDDVMDVIRKVKGVGPKMAQAIEEAVMEVVG